MVNEKGQIKKGELIKRALENAEVLDSSIIRKEIYNYVKEEHTHTNFLALNSRDLNYMQLFRLNNRTPEIITDHIIDFLNDSHFVTCSEDNVLVNTNKIEEHKMSDIKEIDNTETDGLGLYIDGIYFKLYNANWQVEEVI